MKNSFWNYLSQRNKLTFRNIQTGQEHWHLFLSRLHLFAIFLGLIAVSLTLALITVAYTPLMDLIPGNPGYKSRQILTENIIRLDSLEHQLQNWQNYYTNMQIILEGGVPRTTIDSITRLENKGAIVPRSELDSLLRLSHKNDSILIGGKTVNKNREITFEMLPPSAGMITERFQPLNNIYGITISPPPSGVILSVMDGTVIGETWNPEQGETITIQHAGNMVSVYKNINKSLKKLGDRVKPGEPIATSGDIIGGVIPKYQFQLWLNGSPVNPENYIAF